MASYNKFEYRRASHEKFNAANSAHVDGYYAVSHYLAGVSVECMLRAHRWAIDPSWDAKHNLNELIKKSGVIARIPEKKRDIVTEALGEVARRWSVSHRYAPEDRLKAYLRSILRGNRRRILRDNSAMMLAIAQMILQECDI